MKIKRAVSRVATIAVAVIIGVTAAAAFYWKSIAATDQLSSASGKTSDMLLWRAEVFARKAKGDIRDLSWTELWQMTRHRGGFGLANIIRQARSVDGAVVNGYDTDDDHEAGSRIFRARCAMCHGNDGGGWHGGPPLNHSGLKHGTMRMVRRLSGSNPRSMV